MTHRSFNDMLSVFVVILAIFILLAPFLAQLDYFFNGPANLAKPAFVASESKTSFKTPVEDTSSNNKNELYIPSIGALADVIEGSAQNTVDKGLWHRPQTVNPGSQGNSVIVGHRFSYNPSVVQPFYHLDKIKIGDDIYVKWGDTTYHYLVTEKKVVPDTQIEVEAPTSDTRLTLYTCTPLWNPVNRLVITAEPVGGVQ